MTSLKLDRKFMIFLALLLGHVVSSFGSSLTVFALSVGVYLRRGSAVDFTLILLCIFLPAVLVSPVAGALVDRWNRRRVLIVTYTLAALVTLGMGGLHYLGQLESWHIWVGSILYSILGAFFQPAFIASITLLVGREHYGRANGMVHSGLAIARILAPALAGVLVSTIQIWGVLLIDFVTFIFAILILAMIHIPQPQVRDGAKPGSGSLKQESAYAWRYITSRAGLLGLLVFFAFTSVTLGMANGLLTPLVLGFADVAALGLVQTLGGVGMFLGGAVISIWGGPKRRVMGVLGFTLLQGILLCLGGLQPSAWLVAFAFAAALFNSQIIIGSSHAIWQSKVHPELQGRVFSFRLAITALMPPIAYALAGPLADYVFEPWLSPGGLLAGSVGRIIGVGPGRGIGFLYIVIGVFTIAAAVVAYLYPRLRLVEQELPETVVEQAPPEAMPATPARAPDYQLSGTNS